jgi:hypothetical protein
MAFGDTLRERARQRTARRQARQSGRTARKQARQQARSQRSSGRQTTRQMKIQAKGASGYWSPEAVQARSGAVQSGIASAGSAASDIFGNQGVAASGNGATSKSPVPYPLIVGGLGVGLLVYFMSKKK